MSQSHDKLSVKNYNDKAHFYGRISVIIFALITFSLPLTLWLRFGLLPTREGFFSGLITVWSVMIPSTFGEFLSYAPIVGSTTYYVMLLGGNWMNIRIPSNIVALKVAETDANTEEGDVISTMAAAASVITSEVIILTGVIMLSPFARVFANPAIKVGFEQVVPSMFGAIIIATAANNYKAMFVPVVLGVIIIRFQLIPTAVAIPVMVISSAIVTTILYKLGIYNGKSSDKMKMQS